MLRVVSISLFVCFGGFFPTSRYYSATIIRMSGVKSDEAAIWLSAVTAAVNFLFTVVGLYLVERIGRRPLTLGSLMGKIYNIHFVVTIIKFVGP